MMEAEIRMREAISESHESHTTAAESCAEGSSSSACDAPSCAEGDLQASVIHEAPLPDGLAMQHQAIQQMFGFGRAYAERSTTVLEPPKKSAFKTACVLCGAVLLVGMSVAGFYYGNRLLDQKAQRAYELKKQKEIAAEEARRNRTEYAEIAFLDSLPEQVVIAMDGKKQYARTPDGAYSELRAGKNTWIRYLPVKESTVIPFSFEAEGFRPLTRRIAYYDWFPAHKGDITLQKVFQKIVLEPDNSPRLPACEGENCAWSVFREIVFRKQYSEMAAIGVVDEKDRDKNRERVFKTHPALPASVGLDPSNMPKTDAALSSSARNLLAYIDKHPYALYGTITIESDVPDTRVFFLGEPLMVVKPSGSMSQVRVDPDNPVSFSTYGQGHPILISEPLSIRLEAKDYPAYVTEILPHQWHCEPVSAETMQSIDPPAFTQLDDVRQDFYHYVCDYSIKIHVQFKAIREVEASMNKHSEPTAAPSAPEASTQAFGNVPKPDSAS